MKSQMIAALAILTVLFTCTTTVRADNFFIECDVVFEESKYSPLKKYYESHPGEPKPDMCFRLNDNEYLITVTNIDRIAQGLYYYNSTKGEMELYRSMPLIDVKEEFVGGNNKRYVLLSWSNLHQRGWSYGYAILNLISQRGEKPFVVYDLLTVNEDPVSGLCGEWISKGEKKRSVNEGQMQKIDGYEIVNEDTKKVSIVFSVSEQDCKTLEIRAFQRIFRLVKSKFTE
jgi:hypothetical protein